MTEEIGKDRLWPSALLVFHNPKNVGKVLEILSRLQILGGFNIKLGGSERFGNSYSVSHEMLGRAKSDADLKEHHDLHSFADLGRHIGKYGALRTTEDSDTHRLQVTHELDAFAPKGIVYFKERVKDLSVALSIKEFNNAQKGDK